MRTNPNNSNNDNYSTKGNINPYTGKKGWILSDSKINSNNQNNYDNGVTPEYSNGYQSTEAILLVTSENAYLKDFPGPNGNNILKVKEGIELNAVGKQGGYWKVIHKETEGYIFDLYVNTIKKGEYLKLSDTDSSSKFGYVETEGFMREYPRPTSGIIKTIPAKSTIIIKYKTFGNYWFAEFQGTSGFISEIFVNEKK